MKRKYSASLALALWLCVVAWVSAMIVAKPSVGRHSPDEDEAAAIAQLQLNINHDRQLLAALDALEATGNAIPVDLAVAAPAPESTSLAMTTSADGEPVVAARRLSLILSTDRGHRAVIDEQLVRVGTRLADGSRVHRIGRDRVEIEDAAGERLLLQLPAPFSAQQTASLPGSSR
ncbi:hypothetical protein IP90_00493 [Luteimonas cucumeris]|uniref:Uncharacterized protein n=1 Tax=Luteimonas cucumeris TaxID=985012 RepID=A0A562LF44_9GAMM|nr:hypothetical protein [Luteimonas cucumeris]TWI06228.1 hypothetical protein IP90_00493 [Luteimonas cucumeris]